MSTYYDILRVPEDADDKEIKAAYRQAALAYHPDHMPKGVSKRMREDATQTWLEIQEAFAVLGAPEKRNEYDTLLEEMRRSEEAEKEFAPEVPPPAPPSRKPTPAPNQQETPPKPSPRPQPIPPTKSRSAWLLFCFKLGRHWREVCFTVTAVLFFANGLKNPESWAVMSGVIIFIGVITAFLILMDTGPSWKDKGRYLVNAFCLISLAVAGITVGSVDPLTPKSGTPATDKSPPATIEVAKNMTPSSSNTPFADTLKKYRFEAMPLDCENVPLSRLDSCLAKVKADLEKKYLKPTQEEKKIHQNSEAAIQDVPAFANLTGRSVGTVHNVNANLEARVVLLIEEHQGAIQGCFGVRSPLYGSGPLKGVVKGDEIQFHVTSPLYSLNFEGHRNTTNGWSGTYTAIPLGGKEQYGYFNFQRKDSERYFKDFDPRANCPKDEDINR